MDSVYEDMTTLIANTTMQKVYVDGEHRVYTITPVSGYVLHDKARDWEEMDMETGEMITKLGYTPGLASCGASYDFTANPREFYSVLQSGVTADQVFGGWNNEK